MEELFNLTKIKSQFHKGSRRLRIIKDSDKNNKRHKLERKLLLTENTSFLDTEANSRKKKRRLRKESPVCNPDLLCEEKYSCPIGKETLLENESKVSEIPFYPKADLMKTFSESPFQVHKSLLSLAKL
jgi:hypothetical protein